MASKSTAEALADRIMSEVREAVVKAIGNTGFGSVHIEVSQHKPTVEWENRGRTMKGGVPVQDDHQ